MERSPYMMMDEQLAASNMLDLMRLTSTPVSTGNRSWELLSWTQNRCRLGPRETSAISFRDARFLALTRPSTKSGMEEAVDTWSRGVAAAVGLTVLRRVVLSMVTVGTG